MSSTNTTTTSDTTTSSSTTTTISTDSTTSTTSTTDTTSTTTTTTPTDTTTGLTDTTTTTSSTTPSTTPSTTTTSQTSATTATTTGPANTVTKTSTSSLTITSPITTPTSANNNLSSQKSGFFQNTGAVAATFTVVGLVVLVILIFVITQTLRRRRAKQFDREIAEAAAEAASAPVPVFLDDDDDHYGPGYGSRAATGYNTSSPSGGYSDVSSHGTYGQPPMSHESYGMAERPGPGPGPGPGTFFDHNAMYAVPAAAGAAGIGVARARSMKTGDAYAQALNEGSAPYAAFATSHPQYDMHNNVPPRQTSPGYRGPGSNEGHDPSGYGYGVQSHYTGQSQGSDLNRMKSNGSRSLGDTYHTQPSVPEHPGESYASHYQPGFHNADYQPVPSHPHNLQPGFVANKSEEFDDSAAYGGYTDTHVPAHRSPTPGGLPNPFATDKGDESGDESSGEDSGGRRVLRVANNT